MAAPVAIIKKRGKKYHLVSHKGKTLGVHKTREEALKQEQAIEIAKRARQLADNIGTFLAEQDRDEKGRFSGPGGGGGGRIVSGSPGSGVHENAAHDASAKANKASSRANRTGNPKDHAKAAELHKQAADAHGKITGSGIHTQAESWHKHAQEQHSALSGSQPHHVQPQRSPRPLREGDRSGHVERRPDYKPLREGPGKKK